MFVSSFLIFFFVEVEGLLIESVRFISLVSERMWIDRLLLPTKGPPLKRRAGLRRKQAGRGSYRGS